ncbi:MAG: thiamine phosphate synthase [Paenibacillaceae bacterium]|nr:thiamine phosphate synthase [Paenibacillaceae bacterium]
MLDVMEQALQGGADMVQLRDKHAPKREVLAKAYALRELTRRYEVPLIINDHLDVALAVDADGVHLGQEDLPLAEARRIVGPNRLIGISTHHIAQAQEAEAGGADYIGVGPVYPTQTKPGKTAVTTTYVKEAAQRIRIPFVAIGGITAGNVDDVLAAGATKICAVSAVVGSDDPAEVCRRLLARIDCARPGANSRSTVSVRVNGRDMHTTSLHLEELVRELGLLDKRIVMEVDGAIIPQEVWEETTLVNGATIEIVHFVGGG